MLTFDMHTDVVFLISRILTIVAGDVAHGAACSRLMNWSEPPYLLYPEHGAINVHYRDKRMYSITPVPVPFGWGRYLIYK